MPGRSLQAAHLGIEESDAVRHNHVDVGDVTLEAFGFAMALVVNGVHCIALLSNGDARELYQPTCVCAIAMAHTYHSSHRFADGSPGSPTLLQPPRILQRVLHVLHPVLRVEARRLHVAKHILRSCITTRMCLHGHKNNA